MQCVFQATGFVPESYVSNTYQAINIGGKSLGLPQRTDLAEYLCAVTVRSTVESVASLGPLHPQHLIWICGSTAGSSRHPPATGD